jgi:hypothetical protein
MAIDIIMIHFKQGAGRLAMTVLRLKIWAATNS